jgi:hypothetical protein
MRCADAWREQAERTFDPFSIAFDLSPGVCQLGRRVASVALHR